MGDITDTLDDWADEFEYDDVGETYCKHCGTGQLHWHRIPSKGWRLIDESGAIHSCKEFKEAMRIERCRK